MSIKLPDPSKTRNSRRAGVRPRSRFRVLHRLQTIHAGGRTLAQRANADRRPRPLSIRRGQVWTSVVRMARDARAEQYRADRIRYLSNLHEVGDEEAKAAAARELHRVPDAPAAAARFEAPLVRDKRTAKPNKYATAPAGTRATHKRTVLHEGQDQAALFTRTAQTAARETAQSLRRAGFSASEIRAMVWEPLRIRREIGRVGYATTIMA